MARDTGARHRILRYLRENGGIYDRSGRATHELKTAVGYEGSTVGFTQLLASMATAGLVLREVRGKRTYRISLPPSAMRPMDGAPMTDRMGRVDGAPASALEPSAPDGSGAGVPISIERMAGGAEVDYDLLAARLLRQVARNLSDPSSGSNAAAQRRIRSLETRVSELERELARSRAERNQIAEERDEVQARLRAAESNLTTLTDRMTPQRRGDGPRPQATENLDTEERALLRRLSSA